MKYRTISAAEENEGPIPTAPALDYLHNYKFGFEPGNNTRASLGNVTLKQVPSKTLQLVGLGPLKVSVHLCNAPGGG